MTKRGSNLLIAVGLFSAFHLAGCVSIQWGSPPKIDRLQTLKLGVSRQTDVLLALGEPRGHGLLRHAADPTPYIHKYTAGDAGRIGLNPALDPTRRAMWFYEYLVASGRQADITILLVFFLDDVYDGHLWFSAAKLRER